MLRSSVFKVGLLLSVSILFCYIFLGLNGVKVTSDNSKEPRASVLSEENQKQGNILEEEKDPLLLDQIPPLQGLRNILVLGVDNTEDVQRSDTMMLLSLDPVYNEIKVASFLRDNYVDIPNYGKYKLNAAYSLGGPELVMQTIHHNFGISLEDYVMVNFGSFADIIDDIGGLDLHLTKAEAEQVFGQADFERYERVGSKKEYFTNDQVLEGDYHLGGEDALTFCRIRKIDNDFGRTNRQRIVMEKIYEKTKEMDAFQKLSFGVSMISKIETNIGNGDMLDLIKKVIKMGDLSFYKIAIPAEGTYSFEKTADGQDIISLNFDRNKKILYEFLNTSQKEISEAIGATEGGINE